MLSNICPPSISWDYIERGVVGTGLLACPWSLDIFPEVQRQEAAALGQRSDHFPLSPRIARLWAIRGERPGEGGVSLPIGESRVSLFFLMFSPRSVIFANGHGLPPHPDPLPQRPPRSGGLWGRGRNPLGFRPRATCEVPTSHSAPRLMSVAPSGLSKEAAASCRCSFKKCPNSRNPALKRGVNDKWRLRLISLAVLRQTCSQSLRGRIRLWLCHCLPYRI